MNNQHIIDSIKKLKKRSSSEISSILKINKATVEYYLKTIEEQKL